MMVKICNKHLSFISATAEFVVISLVLYDVEFPTPVCTLYVCVWFQLLY